MRIVIEIDTGAQTPTIEVEGTTAAPTLTGTDKDVSERAPADQATSGGAGPSGVGASATPAASALQTRSRMAGAYDGGAAPTVPADGAPPAFTSGPPAAAILGEDQSESPRAEDVGDISAGAAPGASAEEDGVVTVVEQPPDETPEAEVTTTAKPARKRRT